MVVRATFPTSAIMSTTKSHTAAVSFVVLGLVTFAVSLMASALLPDRLFWTTDQAKEQAISASRLHQTTHETAHVRESPKASEADKVHALQQLEAAQARYDLSRSALDNAQFWRKTVPRILRWAGGAMTAIGVLIYLSATGMKD